VGHGIVCLPTFIAGEDLRLGNLVRVLPKQLSLEVSAFAIHPQNRHPSPKVRVLIDYLAESLGPRPEWDQYKEARRVAAPRRR
jgi:DNA-binding transcriptional LysR family regulator